MLVLNSLIARLQQCCAEGERYCPWWMFAGLTSPSHPPPLWNPRWPSWPACLVSSCPCLCFQNPSRHRIQQMLSVSCTRWKITVYSVGVFNCDPLTLFYWHNRPHITGLSSLCVQMFQMMSLMFVGVVWAVYLPKSTKTSFVSIVHLFESGWIHSNLRKIRQPPCIPVYFPPVSNNASIITDLEVTKVCFMKSNVYGYICSKDFPFCR